MNVPCVVWVTLKVQFCPIDITAPSWERHPHEISRLDAQHHKDFVALIRVTDRALNRPTSSSDMWWWCFCYFLVEVETIWGHQTP